MFKFKFNKTLTFYMKSGNKIVIDGVDSDFTIKHVDNVITQISEFKQAKSCKTRLMLASIDLSQIEAITSC